MLDGLEIYETLYWLLYVATCVNRHIQASLVKHGLHSSVLLRSCETELWKQTGLPASTLQLLLSSVGLDPAEGHADHLDTLLKRGVAQREAAIQAADELLKSVLGRACQRVEVFGSCKYGPALPSADIDIIAVVDPQALGASSRSSLKARVQDRLRVLADEARASPGFSRVCLAAPKSTVCLRFADHSLDVTMGTEDHRPMKLSNQVKTLLDEAERTGVPPCGIRRLLRVVLDWATQHRFCHRGAGAITKLKSIHWAILVWAALCLPWCEQEHWEERNGLSLSSSFAHVLRFLMEWPFAQKVIVMCEGSPYSEERWGAWAGDLVVILDENGNNMAARFRTDEEDKHGGLERLRMEACSTRQHILQPAPQAERLWQGLAWRWSQFRQGAGKASEPCQAEPGRSTPSTLANVVTVDPPGGVLRLHGCSEEAEALAEQLAPFTEWRAWTECAAGAVLWPCCTICGKWGTSGHVASRKHARALSRDGDASQVPCTETCSLSEAKVIDNNTTIAPATTRGPPKRLLKRSGSTRNHGLAADPWWSAPSALSNVARLGPDMEVLRRNGCTAEAEGLAQRLAPFAEWREWAGKGLNVAPWPYCKLCDLWATEEHVAGRVHCQARACHPWFRGSEEIVEC